MTEEEVGELGAFSSWVGVIGYPAYDSRNDHNDQQRIFEAYITTSAWPPARSRIAFADDDELQHDATTLGGNSGSVVVDLASGKALGLHFGGSQGDHNYAVPAPRIARFWARPLTPS